MSASKKDDEITLITVPDNELAIGEQNDGNNARASLRMSGDVVTRGTAHYPDAHRDAVRWLFFHCVEEGLHLKAVCKELKRDDTTITRVFRGEYRNPTTGEPVDLTRIVADIHSYRERWEQGQILADQFHWIQTPEMGQTIWEVCDFAAESQTIAFIWGESQTGKSEALRAYQRGHNHGRSKYSSMLPASGQLMMLREIAKACAISPKTAYDKLIERIIRSLDKSNLLIVDELHQVTTTYHARSKVNCLELLRMIHDRSGCGMVLCGTNTFRDEVQEGKDKKLLEQLLKRGPALYQCPSSTPERDIDAIVAGWKLPRLAGEERETVMGVVKERGMKVFSTFVKSGHRNAAKRKEKFAWEHFLRSWRIMSKLSGEGGAK